MHLSRSLATTAGAVYGTTALLGVGLATGLWRNRRNRWIHHVGYIAAVTLTAGTVVTSLRTDRIRAACAAVALVPLAILPRVSTRSRRHPVIALAAAPWLAAAIIRRTR
ncbi:hypothetical protein [Agrococcus sp. Marseille-P2731]|uniref:hypothetical protein n=1 Tax=Agrococcus sp. Marseille-P2731 TaxID=1841862 RepID=UPI000930C2FA|nr:hypothetical protein [Agrococcus sp. Marseille-P2731]